MITLTLNVPLNDVIMAQGFTKIQMLRSSTHTSAGPYANVGSPVTMVLGTTTYTFTDVSGVDGDWYVSEYYNGSSYSSPSAPQPAYLTNICNMIRDTLGITTNEASDAMIQELQFLPSALARARQRISTFDTVVYTGGDPAILGLGAVAALTAAMLCPRMTVKVTDIERFRDYMYERNRTLDWKVVQQELTTAYNLLISQAAGESSVDTTLYYPGVVMAGPTSAGFDTSAGLVPLLNTLFPYTLFNVTGGVTSLY